MNPEAYILTYNSSSERCVNATNILKNVGYNVCPVSTVSHRNREKSCFLGMCKILSLGIQSNREWFYIFEDDICLVEPVTVSELFEYENLSTNEGIFYLGCCNGGFNLIEVGKEKYRISNPFLIHCTHALAITKTLAVNVLAYITKIIEDNPTKTHLFDRLLPEYLHNNNIFPLLMRANLKSPQNKGHLGVFYQNRNEYPSIINS